MANTPATGTGPFEFTSASGKHISIPLSAFSFDANNNIVVDAAWSAVTGADPAASYLSYAVKEGLIAPKPLASPFPAMIVRAADVGTGGNNISVTVAVSSASGSPASDDPTQTPFSLTVTETDVFNGLTAATVESMVNAGGGLVQVVHGSVDTSGTPVATTGHLTGSPAQLDIDGDGSPSLVFTLVAKKSAADSSLISVVVTPQVTSPPSGSGNTFTLQASWTKTVNNITLADLDSVASDMGYEITLSKPASGAYSVPAPGVYQLSGGSSSGRASATLAAQ